MRILCAAAALCLLPIATSAQDALPSAALQMGLPSASLDRRPLDAPPRDLFRAAPTTFAPSFHEPPRIDPRFLPCCGGFFGPIFVPVESWWAATAAAYPSLPRTRVVERQGYLRLLVQPGDTQIYVDGFYVGTVNDLGRQVTLEPGPHRIELRAMGYDSVAFDVRVAPGDTRTYRGDLPPSAPAEKPPAPAPGVPKTFYVIPNCYAGDRPPDRSALPRTCDIARLRTIPPVVSSIRRP